MAKLLLVLLAVCVAPSLVAARCRSITEPFLLKGSAYCDTCQCGYQNDASKSIAGAVVRVECRDRATSELTYTQDGITDSMGEYEISVYSDCGDDYCDAVLVSSPDPECSEPDAGRDRARVILTSNNGMNSKARSANPMGFRKRTALANCPQILKKYQEVEED